MKKIIRNSIGILLVAFTAFSFTSIKEIKREIDAANSKVTWKAYKVAGSHFGEVKIKSGDLLFDGDKLTGGSVTIDMTSIGTLDLSGEYKNKLDGHLKSGDFFGVDKHNTSKIVFTKVKSTGKNAYKVKGDLTIKGKTHEVAFTISVYGSKATANLKVDRTKYDIKYGSASFFDGLKDKAIYDEFDLVVDLQLK
ncbi:YceI family protein [Tenacibaculum sp. M341]|uniref:YceI family protein n=1 Tax=Tenacibaculum sp. M341 TaxID=2530339 RepID=UPI001051541C|nr:YceI family protein [Tenacibaculum sp. M341]TCI92684.1 YceI family protein [Tenacibaculum sp. M341]